MDSENSSRHRFLLPGIITALVAFLPFARVFVGGESFYFRDLSGQFFPARRFLIEGLLQGEWRFWNPLVHEGVPSALSPFGYLPDLLQLLIPNEFGISFFLALHIPLAAVAFLLLARELGLPPKAAMAGGFIYALGGFSFSTINLYVYTQTLAWAPLFLLAFRRAVESGAARSIALAALALAIMVSSTGIEIAIQACLLAVLIAPPSNRSRFLRSALCATLGLALSAAVVVPLLGLSADSERGAGFPTSVVLANSIHPLGLAQVLIAGFFGDTSNLTGTWWGVNFFPRGFPYLLSLYLGPLALALACAGVMTGGPLRRRLALVALGAAWLCLGRYAGWEVFFDLSPSLRFLRYPVKAFFTVQFSVALLASFAVQAIETGPPAFLRKAAVFTASLGGVFVGLMLVPSLAPSLTQWFLHGFLPESVSALQRSLIATFIVEDAATSGLVAVALSVLCLLAHQGRLARSRVATAAAALLAADLIRAGAGLNASVTADFYRLSSEMSEQAQRLRASGGRVFTCNVESSPSYWRGRRERSGNHEVFTMAVMQETLTPDFNVPFGVRTALSIDRTMLVPMHRVLSPELATCADFPALAARLRAAGVTRVLSLEPLSDPALRLLDEVAPVRIAPLVIRIHELKDASPRFSQPVTVVRDIPNELHITVQAAESVEVTIRDPFAKGWRATVNDATVAVTRTAEGHRALPMKAGPNDIRMRYLPPGLETGMAVTLAAALACLGCVLSPRRNRA